MRKDSKSHLHLLTPIFGICLFAATYIYAAMLYPGGSRFDKNAAGFSIFHNYWCDLFDVVTYNGTINPARPIAIVAMFVLCASFGLLWYFLPQMFGPKNLNQKVMQTTGIGAMFVGFFLFTKYHEEVIHLSGFLGGLALICTFFELLKTRKKLLFNVGILCLTMSCVNYFIYTTKIGLPILAFSQKLTFLAFFIWAGMLNLDLYMNKKLG
jgi:uncharacterized membrane protein